MRSFWQAARRFDCHCHCYRCIENRHIHVRKLFTAVSRVRTGRFADAYGTGGAVPSWQRRHFKGIPRLQTVKKEKHIEAYPHQDQQSDEGNKNWQPLETRLPQDQHELHRRRAVVEQDLADIAGDLKSLTIDHWSIDDVVTFEPMPGGSKPPVVPSTTTADPNFMMPQSPWASDALKRQNYARVWTRKKIAKMETGIARFVLKTCRLFHLYSQRPSNLLVLPEAIRPFAKLSAEDQDQLEKLLTRRLKMLANRFGHVAPNDACEVPDELKPFIPHYEHDGEGLHHDLLRDLNASLVELFDGYKHKQLDFLALMVKQCHNLLVSSAPPNVQTMNVLLLGFYTTDKFVKLSALEVRHLVMDWLVAICLAVKIRPNEVTCSTILATYLRRGMRTAFMEFTILMRGTSGTNALMFTKPLTISRQSESRLTPTADDPTIFKQSIYPSPMIFSEVIKGVAKFFNLRDAIAVCKDFTAKEWGYDWSCLRYLLQCCIVQSDWESGLWVWSEIKSFRAMGHQEPLGILAAMLALCVQCKQEDMFAEVLTYTMNGRPKLRQETLIEMATGTLNRAVERMDEDELAAAQVTDGDDEADRSVYHYTDFEAKLRRRLVDDPHFRRAVLGFQADVQDRESKFRYFDEAPDRPDTYDFRSLRSDAMQERLGFSDHDAEPMHDDGEFDRSSASDRDLLRDAEGGDDLEDIDLVKGGARDSSGVDFDDSPVVFGRSEINVTHENTPYPRRR